MRDIVYWKMNYVSNIEILNNIWKYNMCMRSFIYTHDPFLLYTFVFPGNSTIIRNLYLLFNRAHVCNIDLNPSSKFYNLITIFFIGYIDSPGIYDFMLLSRPLLLKSSVFNIFQE